MDTREYKTVTPRYPGVTCSYCGQTFPDEAHDGIFDADGNPLGLYDVCDWWIKTYPADVFVSSPESIVRIRMLMKKVLAMREKKEKK